MKTFIRIVLIGEISEDDVVEVVAQVFDTHPHNPFTILADDWEIEVGTSSDLEGETHFPLAGSTYYLDCWPDEGVSWSEVQSKMAVLSSAFGAVNVNAITGISFQEESGEEAE
ncbi:hypothetical protein ACFW2Y_31660 [Streptomyces sp. NPDC058877]|uniref:hypothetical protein n=1 Tax=Streptomyces sp. NPDC058877 TaxID=3346665 RepID=UPI003686FAF1